MTGSSWVDQRLELSRWTALLAVGDLVAIGAFVAAGQAHHTGENPFLVPGDYLGALAPFLVGWIVVALIGGLYTHDALLGPRRMLSWSLPAWLFGAVIALALRATPYLPGNVNGLFPVVAVVFGGLLVVGWRTVAAAVLPKPS